MKAKSGTTESVKIAEKKARQSRFFTPVSAVSGLLLTAAAAVLVWQHYFHVSAAEQIVSEYKQTQRLQRLTESRIAGFGYAPFSETRGDSQEKTDTATLNRTEGQLINEITENPTAENLHFLGQFYLSKKDFDAAADKLGKAAVLAPQNAAIAGDLGAVYLEQSKNSTIDGTDLALKTEALKNFEKAIEINPNLHEARFNEAVCLQSLHLNGQSRQAWQDFLALDGDSEWANEARRKLEQLEKNQVTAAKTPANVLQDFLEAYDRRDEEKISRIISQTKEMNTGMMVMPQLARKYLAADSLQQKDEAGKTLEQMRLIGELERRTGGDLYFAELARFYASTDKRQKNTLLQAQNFLAAGYAAYSKADFPNAAAQFARAAESNREASNTWETAVADFWLGICNYKVAKNPDSTRQFLKMEENARNKKHKWLQVQIYNQLIGNCLDQNDQSKALEYSAQALTVADEIGDTYNRQKNLSTQVYIYRVLQNYPQSLAKMAQIPKSEDLYYSSQRQGWRNYLTTAEVLSGLKNYRAAAFYGREALDLSLKTLTSPNLIYDSRRLLSGIYGGMQRYSEASNLIETGLQEIRTNESAGSQNSFIHLYLLQKANLERQAGNYRQAAESYRGLIEIYSQSDFANLEITLYEAHKGLLRCYFALGEDARIEAELPPALELFEKNRAKIIEEKNRFTFFDNEQDVYDLAIGYALSKSDAERAFNYAETSKARALLDSMSQNGNKEIIAQSKKLVEIRQNMPEDVQILQYAVLPDKIVMWIVTKNDFKTTETMISAAEINEKVFSFLNLITTQKDAEQSNVQARELDKILIQPALPFLDQSKKIMVVADKSLYNLSFASLVSPADGRYLLEDFTILSAPSASVFLLSTEAAARHQPQAEEKLLSFGNPQIDRREYPDLDPLPDAENEVREISRAYAGARTFTAIAADKTNLLKNLPTADVFHFAGHYVVGKQFPPRFQLLLATNGQSGEDGNLEIKDISPAALSSLKLIVLSACQTGTENYFKGEGMVGAARAFLAQGVPVVVASQWSVDSAATAELMIRFHRYRRLQKLSTAAALRQAQLDLLRDPQLHYSAPFYWAGFSAIGGETVY